jgi:curved DNA-binding protein
MSKRDYYDILGVSRTASADEIKSAHRRLARKFHPDANKNDSSSTQKFQEVQEAYDTLGDADKRRQYDQFGHAGGPNPYETPYGSGQGHSSWDDGGVRVEDFDFGQEAGGGGGHFGEMFDSLFGTRGPFGRGRRNRAADEAAAAQTKDVEYPLNLTFEQAVGGTSLPFTINRGHRTETIEVKIPAGVKTGSRVRIKGRGNVGPSGPGDLFIIVNVQDHPYFKRDGLDVLLEVPISIYESMLGSKITVPTLAGQVTINIPAGTSSGAKLRIKGHGVTRGPDTGDQYCLIKIVVPKDLNAETITQVEQIQRAYPLDPRANLPWK